MIFNFLEWLNGSWVGQAATAPELEWLFLLIQAVHLLSMVVLGGTVLLTDMRLMGWVLTDVSSHRIADAAHRWFKWSLCIIVISGIYMVSAIYLKAYYNFAFRAKMLGLLVGIIFVWAIKRPLLSRDHSDIQPWLLKTVASASIALWFTVACCGRWIGFS
jgi:hypothetical protein